MFDYSNYCHKSIWRLYMINHKHLISMSVLVLLCCFFNISAQAFDDTDTHRRLTEAAIINNPDSALKKSLVAFIGYSSGFKSAFQGIDSKGNYSKRTVLNWLQEGSTDEDALNICRASSHFHNPLFKTSNPSPPAYDWLESQMSDSTFTDFWCGTTKRYSAVTWATGYKSPTDYIGPRTGQYLYLTGLSDAPQNMGWDDARVYLYSALTYKDPAAREAQFVRTFRAVGQVMHLLQDMAVPAHVRNDMESHLINTSIWKIRQAGNWGSNPFEKYVKNNASALAAINITPAKPTFAASAYVTDFWDKNVYTGANQSTGTDQGLAEYTNANYFSTFTIPFNRPSAKHQFPYPQITNANYICTDKLPTSGEITKYVSREPCPTGDNPVDHFAAVSLLNKKGTLVSSLKKVWLDDNVHDTYAQTILPRTVGYSAALLDYFFRGTLNVTAAPEDITFRSIKVTAQNSTPNEAMGSGEVSLIIRYKALTETGSGSVKTVNNPSADYSYKVAKLQNVNLANPRELTFDLSADPLPLNFSDMTMQLVYSGLLGNESGAVAVSTPYAIDGIYTDFDLSLPQSGVYAKTSDNSPTANFNELRLAALSDIPGGLTGGTITLALEYRTAIDDQFQSQYVDTNPANDAGYIYRTPAKNGVNALPQGVPVELVFDLPPLPVQATDVEISIIYTKADGTQAIGYRDISEPTPVDVFNNTDRACINNQWYVSGSQDAYTAVGVDTNGDPLDDIFDHRLDNVSFWADASGRLNLPLDPVSKNLTTASVNPGEAKRLGYILTDYEFNYAFDEQVIPLDPRDNWLFWYITQIHSGTGFTNQAGKGFSGMYTIRGKKMWWGASLVYDLNDESDALCGWETLP